MRRTSALSLNSPAARMTMWLVTIVSVLGSLMTLQQLFLSANNVLGYDVIQLLPDALIVAVGAVGVFFAATRVFNIAFRPARHIDASQARSMLLISLLGMLIGVVMLIQALLQMFR